MRDKVLACLTPHNCFTPAAGRWVYVGACTSPDYWSSPCRLHSNPFWLVHGLHQVCDYIKHVDHMHDPVALQVAARLWRLLVVDAGLMSHLAAIKEYLLLARGDFYHCFLTDASRLMAGPPRLSTADADISHPYQAAAVKTSAQHDPLFKLFKIHFSDKKLQVGGAYGQQSAHVTCQICWLDACCT